jgi:hypothetical protein
MRIAYLSRPATREAFLKTRGVILIQEMEWAESLLLVFVCERHYNIAAFLRRLHTERSQSTIGVQLLNN